MIDVNALIGPYPFRFVPHPDPDVLARVLEREGLSGAWVVKFGFTVTSMRTRSPCFLHSSSIALFPRVASAGDGK